MTAFGANTYTYNADGLRTSKTTADGAYTYMWQGDTLLGVTHGAVTAYFYYHADGSPLGFRYVDSTNRIDSFYTYVLGYAGDVEMIVDMDGHLVVNYSYDAWGNPGTPDINHPDYAANLPLNGVVTINPFRYRGYLYDSETGLYYLRSRYYDPATGRFLSPDSIDYLEPTDPQGLNLYAYCENDPVNNIDPTGQSFIAILAAYAIYELIEAVLLVVAVAVGTALVVQVETDTHILSNTYDYLSGKVDNLVDNLKDKFESFKNRVAFEVSEYVHSLTLKKQSNGTDKHHIVARIDSRAEKSRAILIKHGIGINSDDNLVEMKREYHWILHTNLYYTLLEKSLSIADSLGGETAVRGVLKVFKGILGKL